MPTERSLAYWQRVKWGEGLALLLAAPFLLFPERFTGLTTITLLLLAILWLAPIWVIRSPLIPPTPYNLALVLLGLTFCVAILVTADPELTLPKATGIIFGLGIWRYLVLAVRHRSSVWWAAAGYITLGLGFITFGLLNANWLDKTASRVPFLGGLLTENVFSSVLVQGGIGIHPNQIAGTITLVLPLLVALWAESAFGGTPHRRIIRWTIVFVTFFCGIALLLTQSRSAWLGVLTGLLLLLLLWGATSESSRNRRLIRIGAGVLIALVLLLLVAMGPQRIQQLWLSPPQETAVGSLSTLNFRQHLWPWAIQAVGDFPITGTGLGTFRQVAGRLYPIPIGPDLDFAHAHNVFLQVVLDLGIPGLIAYIAILLLSATIAWQLAKGDPSLRALSLGLLASLAAFHIFGLVDTLALGSKSAVLIWVLLGLFAAMIRLR